MMNARVFRFLVIFTWLIPVWAYSQRDCMSISKKALEKIPELYAQGNRSSIDSMLNTWLYQCGKTEFAMRLNTLLAIQDDRFTPYQFDFTSYQALIGYIEDEKFRILMDSVHENPREIYLNYFIEPDLIFGYTEFTKSLARSLRKKLPVQAECSSEQLVLDAYSNEFRSFFTALKDPTCNEPPGNYFKSQLRSVENRLMVDVGVFTGIWMPYGKAALLGNHPTFGFWFGFGRRKMTFDLAFELRFGKSKENYIVQYQGAPTTSSHFFGGYFGIDMFREIISFKHSKLYVIAGIGADGFDTVKSDPDRDIEGQSIFVFNLNGGIGYKRFTKDGAYVGVDVRHNFVNYDNPGGTSFDGNTMSVRLAIGLHKNDARQRQIDNLKSLAN
jgi:hypothetical protein